jgi:hypothetical protein
LSSQEKYYLKSAVFLVEPIDKRRKKQGTNAHVSSIAIEREEQEGISSPATPARQQASN